MRRLLLALLFASGTAHAHKPSDSYLTVLGNGAALHGQWDIALRDLEYAIGLDADGDGNITWGELKAKHAEIDAYALARLAISAEGKPCRLIPTAHLVDDHTDGAYAVLRFDAQCEAASQTRIVLDYKLFFDLDPTHRGLLRADLGSGTQTAVLSPTRPRIELDARPRSLLEQFGDYLGEGVWHIWIGFDHILFLLSLLLPSVLLPVAGGWRPAERFGEAFWDVVKVATAFTLAHSITLSLAALSVIELPSRLVESAIAFSVVAAALNNLRPLVQGRRWLVAFGFGLIHGFGFASVLTDLGLPREALLLALVGFNVGVEVGQLSIIAVFLPLAFVLRQHWIYRRLIFIGGSAAIAVIAAIWLVERAFDVKLY
ncbi:MAG: HupE/UreJ family protein [Betaproteobacteria bacterium]|nr:HupE/UreJ family protein [Betaproteobacteria bacterium]MBV9360686.1 HupE/UreJ family protein [Betaproteobacteria bacterium]